MPPLSPLSDVFIIGLFYARGEFFSFFLGALEFPLIAKRPHRFPKSRKVPGAELVVRRAFSMALDLLNKQTANRLHKMRSGPKHFVEILWRPFDETLLSTSGSCLWGCTVCRHQQDRGG